MTPSPLFEVLQAGPLTLLQDQGRFGLRHLGVTQGGPADGLAFAWANHLLNQATQLPCLEVLYGGLSLLALADCWISVTGAELDLTLDGRNQPLWEAFPVRAGQKLTLGFARRGLRAYLALAGGWHAPLEMGSCAAVPREGLGGHQGGGRALASGDQLLGRASNRAPNHRPTPPAALKQLDYVFAGPLDLLPGAQIHDFSGASLFAAFNQPWQVSQRADRMGVQLLGPRLDYRGSGMISEGMPLGSVQVPPDGQPFVLMQDRQTIGGYPRLGALTPLACSRLAQHPPGSPLRLRACTERQALESLSIWQLG
ncbi:biotin-dependent carboxyltransferase family protein [Marinospirillum sp. MEB164]|uniref:Biotin-dependent carboxyltransferase family protein n=1 Tax=Marinospirillum alkalitolerans TaxID=3123374 RepID=A0ABW8PVE9_9GAMM